MGIPESEAYFIYRYIIPALGLILFFAGILKSDLSFIALGAGGGLLGYILANSFDKG